VSSRLAIKCRWLKVPVLWKVPTSRASITTDAGGRSFQLDARREASVIRAASLNLPAAALHLSEFRAIEASICRVGVSIQEGRGLSAPRSVSSITAQTGGTAREKPLLGKDVCRGQNGD
jgi:hypothetical protein